MRHVKIIEESTGNLVCKCPIILGGLNYDPTEKEYISEAWRVAIEDRLVEKDDFSKYRFDVS
jgi:hypothetical protein